MVVDSVTPITEVKKLRFSKVKEFTEGQKGLSDSNALSLFIGIISRKCNHLYSLAINVESEQALRIEDEKIKTKEKFFSIYSWQLFK